MRTYTPLEHAPAYAIREVGQYLRLSIPTVRRWSGALGATVIVSSNEESFAALSYVQLLELHVLKSMRIRHEVPLQRIRKTLDFLQQRMPSPHPLLDRNFRTDGLNLFLEHDNELINTSRGGQSAIRTVVDSYLSRIEWANDRDPRFFPFVESEQATEPKSISIQPAIAFGRPVLAGTAILTEIVAGRFAQRESLADLAAEYQVSVGTIEEAIRWEYFPLRAA